MIARRIFAAATLYAAPAAAQAAPVTPVHDDEAVDVLPAASNRGAPIAPVHDDEVVDVLPAAAPGADSRADSRCVLGYTARAAKRTRTGKAAWL